MYISSWTPSPCKPVFKCGYTQSLYKLVSELKSPRYSFESQKERPMDQIKIQIGEWSRQKKNSYHKVNVNGVSCHRRLLRKRGGMLRSLCSTWVKFNLNYVYINFWTRFPSKPLFISELYPKFISFSM